MILQQDFLDKQLNFPHVREACNLYDIPLSAVFNTLGLSYPAGQLYIRIFKQEKELEVWSSNGTSFQYIKTYPFTASTGSLGPKRYEGDLQIPEGLYQITNFNPESKFHLSMKINYPNQADTIRNSKQENQGGNIYIHGGNQSTGCIAIGDTAIAELYWLCVKAYVINPVIPIHIFPCRMEERNLSVIYTEYPGHIDFWNSIKPMYHYFQRHKSLAVLTVFDTLGNYQLFASGNIS